MLLQLLSSGGDGLLKLWSVRTAECINTFDEHEGKVRPVVAPPPPTRPLQRIPTGQLAGFYMWRGPLLEVSWAEP